MNALLQSTLMSLENSHWSQQFFGTSGVAEIQRPRIKLGCVLIDLETVFLSLHIQNGPKLMCLDLSLWKDNFGVWSPDPVRLLLLMVSRPSAEFLVLEIILKDRLQAIYFIQPVSCQRRWNEASPQPLRARILSPGFLLLGVFQFRWDLFKYQQRILRCKF